MAGYQVAGQHINKSLQTHSQQQLYSGIENSEASYLFQSSDSKPTSLTQFCDTMSIAIRVIVAVLQLSFCTANKSWELLHSLDSGKSFSSRGTVSLALNDAGEVEISVANADSCLDLQTVNSLAGGLYQIKLIKDNDESTAVLTSVPACQVRRANFRYVDVLHFIFFLDDNTDVETATCTSLHTILTNLVL